MTKNDMVIEIAKETGLRQVDIKRIVQMTLDCIVDVLVSEKRIELRNFGVFEVRERKARKARNPRTGEEVDVPRKMVATFKPGKLMEEKIAALCDDDLTHPSSSKPSSGQAAGRSAQPGHAGADQAASTAPHSS